MNAYAMSGASALGRDHAALRRGSQDSYALGARGDAAWGVVCDGCGSGARSEVGAGLAAALLEAALDRLLARDTPILEIPALAMDEVLAVLEKIGGALGQDRSRAFVCEHLLATVVGFCVRGDEGAAFWCGDGAVVLGDEVTLLEADDRPDYPAYRLLGRAAPVAARPFSPGTVGRIAVATDGFDPELLPDAFGRGSLALKRWMNVCCRNGHFRDDATIVMAELSGNSR